MVRFLTANTKMAFIMDSISESRLMDPSKRAIMKTVNDMVAMKQNKLMVPLRKVSTEMARDKVFLKFSKIRRIIVEELIRTV